MKLVTYECQEPLDESQRFITWLTEEVHITKDKKRTGEVKLSFLPVYTFGEAREVAESRALAFWEGEKAKKQALKDRGRVLGKLRAKDARRIV